MVAKTLYQGCIFCYQVVKNLTALYGGLYTEDNVAISGIHTHSGPGGYWQYVLYEVTSLGFVKQSLDVIVNGIVESIKIGRYCVVLNESWYMKSLVSNSM